MHEKTESGVMSSDLSLFFQFVAMIYFFIHIYRILSLSQAEKHRLNIDKFKVLITVT